MPLEFAGKAAPLAVAGFSDVTDLLKVTAAEVWAVLSVETSGCGFLRDRRPAILFERHIFHRETKGLFDSQPDISNPQAGAYGAGGAHQYERLQRAIALDRRAALRSASWGLGQVMGFNAQIAGYEDVESMVAASADSEDKQLLAMANEIAHNGLDRPLRSHDWPSFARGYNGAGFARNQYDIRLAAAYQKYTMGLLPDLSVRAAQMYLLYLGFEPGPVDGILGRKTRSAIEEFQQTQGLPLSGEVDEAILERLRLKVG